MWNGRPTSQLLNFNGLVGTSKIVLPSRREANFSDFALLLLNRFFINFGVHFKMDFQATFSQESIKNGVRNVMNTCLILNHIFIDLWWIFGSMLAPRWAPRGTFFTPFSIFFGGIAPNSQKATRIVPKCFQIGPRMI